MNIRKLCLRFLVSVFASMTLVFLYGWVQQRFVFLDWVSLASVVALNGLRTSTTPHPDNIPLESCLFSGSLSATLPVNMAIIGTASHFLGVASSITIISLPARRDRRRDMEALRLSFGIPQSEWRYSDAIGAADHRVHLVMAWVQFVRSTTTRSNPNAEGGTKYKFAPMDEKEVERLANSDEYLGIWDTGPWSSPFGHAAMTGINSSDEVPLLGSAARDDDFPTAEEEKQFQNHKLLTPARVACWYSHLEVIHKIANTPIHAGSEQETHLVLEDDVDMEADIEKQMGLLWVYLRDDWDVVFLGHCWSNESHHIALTPQTHPHLSHALHPSRRPKCTHAYALSRAGARRFLLYLRHPPFAFSRAIDQAFAWLIESGRIKGAYSVVPSLVVQRKVSRSDVFRDGGGGNLGSKWKEELRNGVLSNLEGVVCSV